MPRNVIGNAVRSVVHLLVCSALATPLGAFSAQPPEKIGIVLAHTGADPIGARLAFEVKGQLRGGQSYRVDDRAGPRTRYRISIDSLDVGCGGTGDRAAVMVTLVTPDQRYVASWMHIVGSHRVREVTEEVIARIDKAISGDFKR